MNVAPSGCPNCRASVTISVFRSSSRLSVFKSSFVGLILAFSLFTSSWSAKTAPHPLSTKAYVVIP